MKPRKVKKNTAAARKPRTAPRCRVVFRDCAPTAEQLERLQAFYAALWAQVERQRPATSEN